MQTETRPAETVTIVAAGLKAEISILGAELVRLRDEADRDLLWNGDPAFWSGRAPLLFPIVGRVKGDRIKIGGAYFPMRQHGFARQSRFDIVSRDPSVCRMRLMSSEETRRVFPFDFAFEATYEVKDRTLSIGISVMNTGSVTLPVSMGFHPALLWPLPYGADRAAHAIVFERDEPEPIRRLDQGLVSEAMKATPVTGRTLDLRDDLFVDDALVFDAPHSRAVRYGPPTGRGVQVSFPAMPHLGIWSKPGAGFVCIEPWQGHASPAFFDGEYAEKPGLVSIAPGTDRAFGMAITIEAP